MKSFVHTIAATALLATSVTAQYAIDPNSVGNSTRQFWCQQQTTQCPLICLQTAAESAETLSNTCEWESLTYSCVCSNGQSPNVTEFSQTLPYFICTEWGTQCVSNCDGAQSCQAACQQDHPCGATNPERQNTSTLTGTMSSTTTTSLDAAATVDSAGQTIYTGFGDGGAAPTSDGGNDGGEAENTQQGSGGSGNTNGAASHSIVFSTGRTFGTLFVFGALTLVFAVFL